MRRDWVNLFLLIFTTVFLNVVVPGHARGAVTMEGPVRGCESRDGAPAETKPSCAVCVVAARYLPMAVAVVEPPVLALCTSLPVSPVVATDAAPARTYDACGPPGVR